MNKELYIKILEMKLRYAEITISSLSAIARPLVLCSRGGLDSVRVYCPKENEKCIHAVMDTTKTADCAAPFYYIAEETEYTGE